jgi:hypothetical protein
METIMKRTGPFIALFIFCFSASLFGAAPHNKPAAIVLKVTGSVKVQRGDKQKPINGKFTLFWGDKIIAAPGASATVMFSNGKKETVTGKYVINHKNAAFSKKANNPISTAEKMVAPTPEKDADLKSKGGVGAAMRTMK